MIVFTQKMKYACSITILILLAAGASYAQLYEYTDANGNTVFTDSPPSGKAVREKRVGEDRIYRSTHSAADYHAVEKKDGSGSAREGRPKKNYNRLTVELYMADW